MRYLLDIQFFSFVLILFVSSFIFAAKEKNTIKTAVLWLCLMTIGFLGLELVMRFPGVEPYVMNIFIIVVPFWMMLGFGMVNFVYRLIGRKNDAVYYLLLIATIAATMVIMFSGKIIVGYREVSFGYTDIRNYNYHTLLVLPDIAGGVWAIVLLFKEMHKDIPMIAKRIYLLVFTGSVLAFVAIVFTNIVMPNILGLLYTPRIGSSMSAWFLVFIGIAVYKYRFLNIDVESISNEIFEDMNEAVILLENQNYIKRMNRAALSLFNMPVMYAGKKITDLLPDIKQGNVTLDISGVSKKLFISRYVTSDDSNSPLLALVIRDDTSKINARKILRKSRDDLEQQVFLRSRELKQVQRLEALAHISKGISSEFKKYIARTFGSTISAKKKVGPSSPFIEDLEEIETALGKARNVVRQMGYIGESAKEFEPVELHTQIRDILKITEGMTPENVNVMCEDIEEVKISGNPTHIHQLVLNLVTNAVSAVEQAGGEVWLGVNKYKAEQAVELRIGTIEKGDYALITVKDTGHGIAAKDMNHIFDPFFTTRAQDKGTGIGLATVHKIVMEHKGALDVKSTSEEGTLFSVYFPVYSFNEISEGKIKV